MGGKSEINKLAGLINLIVAATIAAGFLFFFSFIIVLIGYVVYIIGYKIYRYFFPLPQYTKWVYTDNGYPLVTWEKDQMYFQTVKNYKRFDRVANQWEVKTEINPVKQRPEDATEVS